MTNYKTGHDAEKTAAKYIQGLGFTVKELNWKTRFCEIDIIAEKKRTVYFIEVKFRTHNQQGEGFDYITPAKLHQMEYAAEFWVSKFGWEGDYRLAAISMNTESIDFAEIE